LRWFETEGAHAIQHPFGVCEDGVDADTDLEATVTGRR
jgi:hypothetical protein